MKEIKRLLQEIADGSGIATNKGSLEGRHLAMEYASCYGGYRAIMVDDKSGGHGGAFGESSCVGRRSKKEMIAFLEGVLADINI